MPSAKPEKKSTQLPLLDERAQRAELALNRIFRLLRKPSTATTRFDAAMQVWCRLDQPMRGMWLGLSQLDPELQAIPFSQLAPNVQTRLNFVLYSMTQFFEKAGELHLAGLVQSKGKL